MSSTENTVRDAIVGAIQDISDSLGFDDLDGNVHDYLLEHERAERDAAYLMANVGGKKKVRAWGVWVVGDDDWYTTGNLTKRNYTIRVVGYYEVGADGEGAQDLVTASRLVRQAIKGLTVNLSGTVDRVIDIQPLAIERRSGVNPSIGAILVGTMVITADKRNPDF